MTSPADLPHDDTHWMRMALAEARLAEQHADVPIGAVVVRSDGHVLAREHNRREQNGDPTAHAEILALRAAASQRGHWRLDDCTLIVTLEPCAMCAGALVNSRIARVVFGATDLKAGGLESLYQLGQDTRLNHRFPTSSGILEAECRELLQAFFRTLRAAGEK